MDDAKTGYWVRFRADGVPNWFGGSKIDGAEWVEGVTEDQLCTTRRVKGKWVAREAEVAVDAVPEPELEPERDVKAELAALADKLAELQAVVEAQE